jgi:hypothetical protein
LEAFGCMNRYPAQEMRRHMQVLKDHGIKTKQRKDWKVNMGGCPMGVHMP